MRRHWDRYWFAWAMVAPVVVVLGVLVFYPLVRGVYLSFTNTTEANQKAEICVRSITGGEVCEPNPDAARFVGLETYTRVLTGELGEFWQQFVVTIIWTVTCVVFHYGIFPSSLATLEAEKVKLHALATWWDVIGVAAELGYFKPGQLEAVRSFLESPEDWKPR